MPGAPRFSFYGDDFTGSTDALEALAVNGIPTVLFLRVPDDSDLAAFPDCRAVGIAGDSRSRSPQWMREALPAVFTRLRQLGAPVVQYKVCSTFDSSPEYGSIGCVIEIAREIFEVPYVPVAPAAPKLRRYVVFGNLFASGGDAIYRIDRHPAMQRHPVTPMTESDLLVHLGRQTGRKLALMDILSLRAPDAGERLETLLSGQPDAIVFDGLEDGSLERSARLICGRPGRPQVFVVGSSGFTYGMMDFWRAEGWIQPPAGVNRAGCVERLLVLAGSCSPATERQIRRALRDGFQGVRLDPCRPEDWDTARQAAETGLAAGKNVVVYSALGLADRKEIDDRRLLGARMGKLLRELILRSGVRRVVIAGGDTASHAASELEIGALTFLAPLVPGAPLCLAHGAAMELELVLKGGQIGPETFFKDVVRGRS
ncbi:MAG TPA: four-carbon acid sugar kinase family protein [Bryobacteraceae bacterium]|nr:four-carbon acid sugar kinase family protein [Bryobacteraceae bacterium]